jgi:hypothetical protein
VHDGAPDLDHSGAYLQEMATAAVPSVRRLAQYRPFEHGGLDLRAVLQDLVLAAAAINGGGFDSIFSCKQGFADLWSIEVEIDELRPALERLIERSLIVGDRRPTRPARAGHG